MLLDSATGTRLVKAVHTGVPSVPVFLYNILLSVLQNILVVGHVAGKDVPCPYVVLFRASSLATVLAQELSIGLTISNHLMHLPVIHSSELQTSPPHQM